MKWSIIGTGWISKQFAQALLSVGEEITSVISRNNKNGEMFAKELGINNSYLNLEEDIESENVYIGTPNSTHYDYCIKCSNLKKNVMVEKPISHDYELTKNLYKLFEESNLKLMEGYIHINGGKYNLNNYKNSLIETNFMQKSSKIKDGSYKNASTFNKDTFGGVISDIAVYPISLCIYLFGEVQSWKVSDEIVFNGLVQEVKICLKHINNNTSTFIVSKLNDGNNQVLLNGSVISQHITDTIYENPMIGEIKEFLSFENYEFNKKISLETNKLMVDIHNYLNN